MKILLLDAYDAASHQYWRAALKEMLTDIDIDGESIQWTELVLPPRYFSWRIRGNSLSWGKGQYKELQSESLDTDFDLVLATSMVDLTSLRGFVPKLGLIPTIVYFHENQFSYPISYSKQPTVEPQIVNLYTALCADKVIFNSEFNQQTFLSGAEALLKKLPDEVPSDLIVELTEKSQVLPVPIVEIEEGKNTFKQYGHSSIKIVWNHRWEYDKGPDRLLAFVREAIYQNIEMDLYVVGERFRKYPKAFDEIKSLLENNSIQILQRFGFIEDKQEYLDILESCDFVLSTSLHDFQGLSVLQAVARGCRPLVPNRMAYPQWFGCDICYSENENEKIEARNAIEHLTEYQWENSDINIDELSLSSLKSPYLKILKEIIAK